MIRKFEKRDWTEVLEIYRQGIESGVATFNTECPSFEEWDKSHLKECRFVSVVDGKVVGWIAVSSTSNRKVYSGVVEVSIYIDQNHGRMGIGTGLMNILKQEAPGCGFWSLFSVILSINKQSIEFHRKCGFREIGYRERVAVDRFGNWQNTTLMEYRL